MCLTGTCGCRLDCLIVTFAKRNKFRYFLCSVFQFIPFFVVFALDVRFFVEQLLSTTIALQLLFDNFNSFAVFVLIALLRLTWKMGPSTHGND